MDELATLRSRLQYVNSRGFRPNHHRASALRHAIGCVSSSFPAPEIPPFRAGRRCGLSLVANVFGDDGKRGAAA
jgi:hypothetical protein